MSFLLLREVVDRQEGSFYTHSCNCVVYVYKFYYAELSGIKLFIFV